MKNVVHTNSIINETYSDDTMIKKTNNDSNGEQYMICPECGKLYKVKHKANISVEIECSTSEELFFAGLRYECSLATNCSCGQYVQLLFIDDIRETKIYDLYKNKWNLDILSDPGFLEKRKIIISNKSISSIPTFNWLSFTISKYFEESICNIGIDLSIIPVAITKYGKEVNAIEFTFNKSMLSTSDICDILTTRNIIGCALDRIKMDYDDIVKSNSVNMKEQALIKKYNEAGIEILRDKFLTSGTLRISADWLNIRKRISAEILPWFLCIAQEEVAPIHPCYDTNTFITDVKIDGERKITELEMYFSDNVNMYEMIDKYLIKGLKENRNFIGEVIKDEGIDRAADKC